MMVKITKKNETFDYPQYKDAKVKVSAPESLFTQNSLLKRLAPSNKNSKFSDALHHLVKKIFAYIIPKTPSRFQSYLIRRIQKQEGITSDQVSGHYRKWLEADKSFAKTKPALHQHEQYEKKLAALHQMRDPKAQSKALAHLKSDLEKDLGKLKEGESRVFAIDRTLHGSAWHTDLFCILTKNKENYSLVFTGSGSKMAHLGGQELQVGEHAKVLKEVKFTNIPLDVIKTSHWLQVFTREETLPPPQANSNEETPQSASVPSQQALEEALKSIQNYAIKQDQYENFTKKTDLSSKIFWKVVQNLSKERSSEPPELVHVDVKQMRLRTHLVQLFELYQRSRYLLKPHSQDYQHLRLTFENVSREASNALKKGIISPEDMQILSKELKIIEEALLKAKKQNKKTFSAQAPKQKFLLLGVQKEEFKTSSLSAKSIEGKSLENQKNASRSLAPLKSQKIEIPAPLALLPGQLMQTKAELWNTLKALREEWVHRPEKREIVQEKFLQLFYELNLQFFDDKGKKIGLWWDFTLQEQHEVSDWIEEWVDAITQDSRFRDHPKQTYFEALAKIQVVHYLWEAEEKHYRTPIFDRLYDSFRLYNSRVAPLQWSTQHKKYKYNSTGIYEHFQWMPYLNADKFLPRHHKLQGIIGRLSYNFRDYFGVHLLSSYTRPVNQPFLNSLVQNATTSIAFNYQEENEKNKLDSATTHEAFQTEPEGVFSYFLDHLYQQLEDLQKVGENAVIPQTVDQPFTVEEQKRILHLLKGNNPYSEVMAFMEDYSYLIPNPDIRNFIQIILFGKALRYSYKDKTFSLQVFEAYLQKKIGTEKEKLLKALKEQPEEHKLIRGRFEVLAFLAETYKKSKGSEATAEVGAVFEELLQLTDAHPYLKDEKGYIAQLILANALLPDTVQPENAKNLDLLQLYTYAFATEIPAYQKDPLLEQDLTNAWQRLLEAAKNKSDIFKTENMAGLLDRLVVSKKLNLDDSAWEYLGENIYQNGTYTVDISRFQVRLRELTGDLELIPEQILNDKTFHQLFPKMEKKPFAVQVLKDGGATHYRFKTPEGLPVLIKSEKGQLFYFQQNQAGEWLQYLSPGLFSPKTADAVLKQRQKKGRGQIGLLMDFLKLMNKKEANPPHFLAKGLFVDPKDPLKAQVLDAQGKCLYKIQFKQQWQGLEIDKIEDLRQGDKGTYQLNLGGDLSTSELKALSSIEHVNNMFLWSQKGSLKKVELPRYGLIFEVQGKQLVVSEGPLKGYKLKLNPSAEDKRKLMSGLVLEPTDPKKPTKLLLPPSRALESSEYELKTKAKGLGKLLYFFQKIRQFIELIKTGKIPEIFSETKIQPDPNLEKLSYTTVDLRPFTQELVLSKQTPVEVLLEVAEHYAVAEQPAEMQRILQLIPLDSPKMDSAKLQKIFNFLDHSPRNLPHQGAATIKLKFAFNLKNSLKKNAVEKKFIQAVNKSIVSLGQTALEEGPSLTPDVALSKREKVELAKLAEKLKASYLNTHVAPLVAEKGTAWSLDEDFPEQKKVLEEAVKSIKDQRPPRDWNQSIQTLEKNIHPEDQLKEADLQYTVKRLPEDQVFYRLFQPKEVAGLFREEEVVLPAIDLKSDRSQLEECEKYSLETLEKDLENYRKAEDHKKIYVLSASPGKIKQFLQQKVLPKIAQKEKLIDNNRLKIEEKLRSSSQPEEQLAIFAGEQPSASFDEVKLAFLKGQLEELKAQKRLPSTLDLEALKKDLIDYFETQVQRNALESAANLLQEALTSRKYTNPEQRKILSQALHHLLTTRCQYDAKEDPRFLVFEAQQFLQFKHLDAGLEQLQLLEALLNDPHAIVQAPTGSGKTAVFSVLRSLLKANGKNLVIQKVLPPLFQQTYDKYNEVLGDLYGTSVYALRFNLKMRLVESEFVKEANKEGQVVENKKEASLFKRMYHDLLTTIETKGCVLTDYKSLPLLEERFWKLAQDLSEARDLGQEIEPIQLEHFAYLRKILILIQNKADENMDEFDQPNRPIHKIQIDLGVGAQPVSPALIDTALDIYDYLLADPELKLRKNVTADYKEEMREACVQRAAKKMAQDLAQGNVSLESKLYEYFSNQNEDVLALIESREGTFKDRVALCKDQFAIFLPLTLRGKEGGRYARSDDGLRTLPCQNGEKHDAKPGTLLEQLNYTIQDYYQAGITPVDLTHWFNILKKAADSTEDTQRHKQLNAQLQGVFPDLTLLDLGDILDHPEKQAPLVAKVNEDAQLIKHFLKYRLSEIKTSGAVVSMDPQQIIDMSAAVSGISATMGAADSLHPQFHVKHDMIGKIRAQMTYRIVGRALEKAPVLHYDPENPQEVLKQTKTPVQAIIDGAGAFRNGQEGAQTVLKNNQNLLQVGYHQTSENIVFEGTPTGDKTKTGFFFSQPYTRGTDIPLPKDVKALLTLNEKDGLRDYFQKEGRLRLPGQKYQLAVSSYRKDVNNLETAVIQAATQDAKVDAQDIFKATAQRLQAILRHEAKKALLKKENPQEFLDLFKQKEMRSLFISEAQASYQNPGEYFEKNKLLRKVDKKPDEALNDYKAKLMHTAEKLGLKTASEALKNYAFSTDLLRQMPTQVSPIVKDQDLEMELQVEQEEEVEAEEHLEVSLEREVENEKAYVKAPLGVYPLRKANKMDHSVKGRIHPAYNEKLFVSDSFLPLSRENTSSLRKRQAFDAATYRVGTVCITIKLKNLFGKKYEVRNMEDRLQLTGVYIEDPLGEEDRHQDRGSPSQISTDNELHYFDRSFWWDIRTRQITSKGLFYFHDNEREECLEKIFASEEFNTLISQVKFFDGQTSGYTDLELLALTQWLKEQGPEKMRDHLLNKVLQYRSVQEKKDFVGSQIDELFKKLIETP